MPITSKRRRGAAIFAHVLLRSVGTGGDVLPFLRIGGRLKARGHSVTLISHCVYRGMAEQAGLDFAALDTAEQYARFIEDGPLLNTPPGIPEFIRRHSLPKVALEYELIRQRWRAHSTVLVTGDLFDAAARIAAEKLGIPLLWVFVAPSQITTGQMRRELFGGVLAADIGRVRSALSLAPIIDWRLWLEYSQPSIALWPHWFAAPDATWPQGITPVGFVLDNEAETDEIPSEVEAILDRGEPPILITPGTGAYLGAEFTSVSAAACQQLNRAGILVARYDKQVPHSLPPLVKRFNRLPFGKLMPRMAAAIHHGGRGTLSCALAAGTPQLVLAHGADRPDNAARLQRLGVAEYLPSSAWRLSTVAEKLDRLVSLPAVRERCRDLADRVKGTDPLTDACQLIEGCLHAKQPYASVATPAEPDSPPISRARQRLDGPYEERRPGKLKILLTSKLPYVPALSGASKGDRDLLQSLARRGHCCRAVVTASAAALPEPRKRFPAELARAEISSTAPSPGIDVFQHGGVEVRAVGDALRLRVELAEVIREFEPDWILVSEDRSYLSLAIAIEAGVGRVIYLCHSQATLPFGPECFLPDPAKTALLRQAAGIIAVSRYVQDYIARWGDLESTALHFDGFGAGPFPHHARFDRGFVTMVNPSPIKGISIFLQLAHVLPDLEFAAVPSWATREIDRSMLQRTANVRLLAPSENIDDIFAQTRVLLVPSLWGEAFGRIVVEAMLCGIPVLAANVGGLPEAKLGVDYLLPVRPIERYEARLDEQLLPIPVIPDQDSVPWQAALTEVLVSRENYQRVSAASRAAALSYVAGLEVTPFENYLRNLRPKTASVVSAGDAKLPHERAGSKLDGLSPARLELLAALLKSSRHKEPGGVS